MPSSRPHTPGRGCRNRPARRPGARLLRACVIALGGVLLTACSTGASPGTQTVDIASLPRSERHGMVFDSVWSIVRREHVDSTLAGVDWEAARARHRPRALGAADDRALYGALAALLLPLGDAHTYVTTPAAVARDQARRTVARDHGLGMRLEPLEGSVVVTGVQHASTAGLAGVRPGWVLRRWNGLPVDSAGLASGRFGAGRGDTVAITFADTAETPHERLLVSSQYDWRHPRAVRREGDVAVVRLTSFETGMGAWLLRTLAAHRDAAGLVLDLRGNPGGQMRDLTLALDAIFAGRQPIGRFTSRNGQSGQLVARGGGRGAYPGRLAVLVDRRSGSAAEIMGAVVQASGRGRVIGERTAGAVLNAFPFRLPDGGRLHVSRRDFRDLCDLRLEHTGIAPLDSADRVARSLADLRRGADPALARALAWLRDTTAAGRLVPRRCA